MTTKHKTIALVSAVVGALAMPGHASQALAQNSRFDELADMPFKEGYIAKGDVPTLLNDLFFQRSVQTYLWALPALNMYGKGRLEKVLCKGHNVPLIGNSGSMPKR